ncbi:DUF624 domain-containing protein [Salinibacterium sp. PAMC 21357]|uniref:DUF624 domain-containing protein n=1 Tax=Salinibacterium sp. PAMC 21357 TaxID=1112215 RepID=UPI001300C72D|nr:DUF624 domain-containing protein [Salinibacterium sp. PAMC 21357]
MTQHALDLGARADVVVRYLWLNVLWLAVALTIVGAPAATVAMHAVTAEWAEGDERPVAQRFFAALRATGLRATAVGAALAIVASLVTMNVVIAAEMGPQAPFVLGGLGAVTLVTALLATGAPLVITQGARGIGGIARAAAYRVATQPAAAVVSLGLVLAIALAALSFPPSLLMLPAPCAQLVHSIRSKRRVAFHLPRTRSERTYA